MEKYQVIQYVITAGLVFGGILTVANVLDENLQKAFMGLLSCILLFVAVCIAQFKKPESETNNSL